MLLLHDEPVRGTIELEMSLKVEKVQRGEGSVQEIKKSTIQNVDFLTRAELVKWSVFTLKVRIWTYLKKIIKKWSVFP